MGKLEPGQRAQQLLLPLARGPAFLQPALVLVRQQRAARKSPDPFFVPILPGDNLPDLHVGNGAQFKKLFGFNQFFGSMETLITDQRNKTGKENIPQQRDIGGEISPGCECKYTHLQFPWQACSQVSGACAEKPILQGFLLVE